MGGRGEGFGLSIDDARMLIDSSVKTVIPIPQFHSDSISYSTARIHSISSVVEGILRRLTHGQVSDW